MTRIEMSAPRKEKRTVPIRKNLKGLRFRSDEVRGIVRTLDRSGLFPCPPGELSLVFMGDAEIAALHGTYFDDPSPTDVITFPGAPEMGFAGEICVSADHARNYAGKDGRRFSRELVLYIVHGYLHLSGYGDSGPEDRRRMRKAEKKALSLLEISGRMPSFSGLDIDT